MGKYTAIIKTLGLKSAPEEPRYQEKVDVVKAEYPYTMTGTELAAAYEKARDEKDELNAQLKTVNMRVTALEQLIAASQERGAPGWGDFGTSETSVRLINGSLISVQQEPHAVVEDHDLVRQWAINAGLERSLALPFQTLNAHVKELLMLGEPSPPGVGLWVRTTVKLTRG